MGDRHLVLFGAGMTGQGQIAQFAFEDGWQHTRLASPIGYLLKGCPMSKLRKPAREPA